MSIFRTLFSREIDWKLAILQVITLGSALLIALAALAMLRHQTDGIWISFPAYLMSAKLAVPPVAILLATYAFALLTGKPASDAPKTAWSWARNEWLQKTGLMSWTIAGALFISVSAALWMHVTPAPQYEKFVARLLGGESDDFEVVKNELKVIKEKNPSLAYRLDLVGKVFEERRKRNKQSSQLDPQGLRYLIRALDTNIDTADSWDDHPLRWHALAEASSMFAQALGGDAGGLAKRYRDKALALYGNIVTSSDPRATPLMRASALHNQGNVFFYAGDYVQARKFYEKALLRSPNVGTDANMLAIHVASGDAERAISFGKAAIERALRNGKAATEPGPFADLVINRGFALLLTRQYIDALDDLRTGDDIMRDANSSQNLALAHIALRQGEAALLALRRTGAVEIEDLPPGSPVPAMAKGHCTYLIRGLAWLAALPEQAGFAANAQKNLAAFYGVTLIPNFPEGDSKSEFSKIRENSWAALETHPGPCGNLKWLPLVKEILRGEGK